MNRITIPDHIIEWDDYFGAYLDLSALTIDQIPDQIEIIHPDPKQNNIIAYFEREVRNAQNNITKWLYNINMKDGSEYTFTLMNNPVE